MIYKLEMKKIYLTLVFIMDICPLNNLDKSVKHTQTPFYLDFGDQNNVE